MSCRVIWWRVGFKVENFCNFDVLVRFRDESGLSVAGYRAWRSAIRVEASQRAVALWIVHPSERPILVSDAAMTVRVAFPVVLS